MDGRLCRVYDASFLAVKLRIQYAGAIYYVMSRGNGKAAVFPNEVDRRSCVHETNNSKVRPLRQGQALFRIVETPFSPP